MDLIIVESPTKAKTITRFLGGEFDVVSTKGHIKDLPKSQLGVDIDHDFAPDYVEIPKKKEVINNLKLKTKNSKQIYIATDPDREGEAIAAHVKEILSEEDIRISRISFHEITKEAVEEAIKTPRDIDGNLVDAQVARRVLDRLVGYKLSPLLWKKVRRGLSAGRVQSVTVRLIVEREREIEAFKPEEFWEIFATVKNSPEVKSADTSGVFVVQLIKKEIENKEQADKILSDLKVAKYKVLDVKKREIRKSPYPPFTTSTMMRAGARIFAWSAKKTMRVAQELYEQGLITYHRTDSTNISNLAIDKARDFIGKQYGSNYLPEKIRLYKTRSKVAQEAHEAIRPTDVEYQVSSIKYQEKDAQRLYDLVWKRFVACQMADAVYDETVIDVQAKYTSGVYLLRASGQTMKFDGWRKLFASKEQEILLPDLLPNDPLQLIKVWGEQKFTQPPARFNEASLIKTLEKLGIGRPSTYAPIISTIQVRQYVEKKESSFFPTPVGIAVTDFLVTNFADTMDYKFTAYMEDDLDKIADGKAKWQKEIGDFWKPFARKLETVGQKAKRVKIEVEKTDKKCPKCKKANLVIRIGRFGKFISCSAFPECKYTEKFVEKVGVKCPECKIGDVVVKRTSKGRSFYGCSRYPDCKWASWRNPLLVKLRE